VIQAGLERATRVEAKRRTIITTWSALLNYCLTKLANEPREPFCVLYLVRKNQIIADETARHG
jgi:DNA repair protein RadC